jgi:AcrR family transcriptional regulator
MAENRKKDRRVLRTQNALHQALEEAIQEKGYDAVTIEDITARANLGRTTFYLHYQDKEDLFLEGLEEYLSAIVDEFNRHPLIFWFKDRKENLIRSVFESIRQNAEIYKTLTGDPSTRVYERFKKVIQKTAWQLINENAWAQKKVSTLSLPVDLIIEYFSGAMWSSVIWWVQNNFEPSTDEMANLFRRMFFPGLLRALNVRRMHDLIDNM